VITVMVKFNRCPPGLDLTGGTIMATKNAAAPWRGPCTSQQATPRDAEPHASWDLDIGDAVSWRRAVQTCVDCPVRAACIEERAAFFPHSNPAGVIWAGVAYSETGKVLDTSGLRRLAATRRNKGHRGRPRRPDPVPTRIEVA